jgi:HEAT repeat protein
MLGRLIGLLASASKEERRRAAAELIASAPPDEASRAALRAALADHDANRRFGAAFVLFRMGHRDDGVFRGALSALGDGDGDVRWAAAEIVVSLVGSDDSRRARVRELAADADAPGRRMALYCLRDLGGNEDDVCVTALSAPDVAVRLAAVACLGRMAVLSLRGVDSLLAAIAHDTDAGVRRAATVALRHATNHDAMVRPVLEEIRARSTDADHVRAAERALEDLATRPGSRRT